MRQLVLEPLGVSLEPLASSRKAFWPMMSPRCKSHFPVALSPEKQPVRLRRALAFLPLVEVGFDVLSLDAQVIESLKGLWHECGG